MGDDRAGAAHAAADEHARARLQFLEREGLHQVIVGAQVETFDPVLQRGARRENQHRDARLPPPQPPQDVDPVDVRESEVENDEIVWLGGERALRVFTDPDRVDGISLPGEETGEALGERAVVLDNEQSHGHTRNDRMLKAGTCMMPLTES